MCWFSTVHSGTCLVNFPYDVCHNPHFSRDTYKCLKQDGRVFLMSCLSFPAHLIKISLLTAHQIKKGWTIWVYITWNFSPLRYPSLHRQLCKEVKWTTVNPSYILVIMILLVAIRALIFLTAVDCFIIYGVILCSPFMNFLYYTATDNSSW